MRKELEHFNVGSYYGGDQEWFSDNWMRIGGCGAVTACDLCIYLARHRGMTALYPFDPASVTKAQYVDFGMQMRPFLRPRATGIDRTSIYVDGFGDYLDARGAHPIVLGDFSGAADVGSAIEAIRDQIDRGFPVPYLMLMHRDKLLSDFFWHWFLLNGYDENEREFRVKAVSYGESVWFDLRHLWKTGHRRKGGFITIRLNENNEAAG